MPLNNLRFSGSLPARTSLAPAKLAAPRFGAQNIGEYPIERVVKTYLYNAFFVLQDKSKVATRLQMLFDKYQIRYNNKSGDTLKTEILTDLQKDDFLDFLVADTLFNPRKMTEKDHQFRKDFIGFLERGIGEEDFSRHGAQDIIQAIAAEAKNSPVFRGFIFENDKSQAYNVKLCLRQSLNFIDGQEKWKTQGRISSTLVDQLQALLDKYRIQYKGKSGEALKQQILTDLKQMSSEAEFLRFMVDYNLCDSSKCKGVDHQFRKDFIQLLKEAEPEKLICMYRDHLQEVINTIASYSQGSQVFKGFDLNLPPPPQSSPGTPPSSVTIPL